MSMRKVLRQKGMPEMKAVWRWLRIHESFSQQYTKACIERTESHQEKLLDLGDEAIELAQNVDSKVSGAVVNAVKLKADNLKWSMSKMKPKKYGEHLDLTTDGEKLPTPIMAIDPAAITHVQRNDSHKEDIEADEED